MFEIQKETQTKDDWVSLVVKLLKVYEIYLQHFTTGSYASWHHLGSCMFGGHIKIGDRKKQSENFFPSPKFFFSFCPDTFIWFLTCNKSPNF